MLRFILLTILLAILFRALSRLWTGVLRGMQQGRTAGSGAGGRAPRRGVQMQRDPVCGTFVVPDRAVALTAAGERVYFCSTACRDRYRSRQQSDSTSTHGRTA